MSAFHFVVAGRDSPLGVGSERGQKRQNKMHLK